MVKHFFFVVVCLCWWGATAVRCPAQGAPVIDAPALARFEQGFRPFDTGWTGADGLYAIPLGTHRVLWVFGDTLLGALSPQGRQIVGMRRNTAALQGGDQLVFAPPLLPGLHQDFVASPGAGQWLWPGPGLAQGQRLWMVMPAFVHVPTHEEAFGFRQVSTYGVRVSNAQQPPAQWRFTLHPLPWARHGARDVSYTAAGFADETHWYLYGYGDQQSSGRLDRRAFLLRLSRQPDPLAAQPAFWDGRGWTSDPTAAQALFSGFQSEASVSYHAGLQQFLMVYTANDFSGRIQLRRAPRPEGPWSDPETLFTPPDHGQGQAFCYAAKHYPHLQSFIPAAQRPQGLVLGYACNSFKAEDLTTQPHLYLPRFVAVTMPQTPPLNP